MSVQKFGRAHSKRGTSAAPIRLIDPSMLPDKGINYCLNHLRRMWKRNDFPEPIRLSERKIAWSEKAIDDWIAAKIAAAEQKKSA